MENNNKDKFEEFLKRIPEYSTYVILALVAIDFILNKVFGFSFLEKALKSLEPNLNTDYRIGVIYLLVVIVATNFSLQFRKIIKKLSKINNQYHGVIEILKPNVNLDYSELLKSKNVVNILTLSGSITGDLGSNDVIDLLKSRRRNSKITILIANPYSTSIINRYQNDEPDNYEAGISVIERRVILLHKIKNDLPTTQHKKLEIRVFNNYPTISITQADNDFYSSVYGYKLRGNDCPTIHAEKNKGYGLFLEKHFLEVLKDSIEINAWFKKYQE